MDERIHHFFNQLSKEQRKSFEMYLQYNIENHEPFDEIQQKWFEVIEKTNDSKEWLNRLRLQEKEKEYRLQKMLYYVHSKTCRREMILDYFGEKQIEKPKKCCDIDGATLDIQENAVTVQRMEPKSWQDILLNLF